MRYYLCEFVGRGGCLLFDVRLVVGLWVFGGDAFGLMVFCVVVSVS